MTVQRGKLREEQHRRHCCEIYTTFVLTAYILHLSAFNWLLDHFGRRLSSASGTQSRVLTRQISMTASELFFDPCVYFGAVPFKHLASASSL